MRRIMLLVVGALALTLAVPSIASAHGRHHRHGHHHAKAHHARVEHFNAPSNTDPSNPSAPADAGTVQSFTGGVLTIALADGSTVSGKVTSDTEINCMGPNAQASRDGGSSGDSGSGDDQGDQQGGDQQGGDQQGGDQQGGDDQGDQQGQAPTCDTTSLTPGTPVHEAILKISSSGGATFKLVLLDPQQAAS